MENKVLINGLVALVFVFLALLIRQFLALLVILDLAFVLGSFFYLLAALALVIFSYDFLPDLASLVLILGHDLLLVAFSFFRKEIHLTYDSSHAMVYPWMVLLLMVTLTSSLVQGSLRDLVIHTGGFLPSLSMVSLVRSKRDAYILLFTLVARMGILSFYGVSQIFTGAELSKGWVDVENNPNVWVRVYSLFGNPNVFAEYLTMVFPPALGLTWPVKRDKTRVFYGGILLLTCISFLFTLSRGGLLGFITGLALFLFLVKKRFLLLGIPGLAALVYLALQGFINRIQSIRSFQDISTVYRLTIWKSSLDIIKDHPRGLGLGHPPFKAMYENCNQIYPAFHAHNTYLELTVEMSLFGLLVFLVFMTVIFSQVHKYLIKSNDRQIRILGAAALAGLLGILVHGIFENVFYLTKTTPTVWSSIATIYSLIKVERKEEAYDQTPF